MKKAPLLTALLVLSFVLTACGIGGATTGSSGGGSSANGFRSSSGSTRALTPDAKLALGTMKLEGTKAAIDPKTAAKLIPLWQLLVQLHSSSSSAPQEVTAVIDQIKATMTPDQLTTINSMTLTQADIFTAFQGQGQANGSGGTTDPGRQGSSQSPSRGNGGNGGRFFFGGRPGGGGPDGGGFGGGGFVGGGSRSANGAGSQTSSALTAAEAAQARENAISSLLINQLIRLLETKLIN